MPEARLRGPDQTQQAAASSQPCAPRSSKVNTPISSGRVANTWSTRHRGSQQVAVADPTARSLCILLSCGRGTAVLDPAERSEKLPGTTGSPLQIRKNRREVSGLLVSLPPSASCGRRSGPRTGDGSWGTCSTGTGCSAAMSPCACGWLCQAAPASPSVPPATTTRRLARTPLKTFRGVRHQGVGLESRVGALGLGF
eukprot:2151917-Pyramimonas_sp.AAC.1